MPPSPHTRGPAAIGSRELRSFLLSQEPLLAASAVAAGLGKIRTRSAPARLAVEAQRFVRLLAAALGPRGAVADSAAQEVRLGAFAASSLEQRARVLALWRRVIPPVLEGQGRTADVRRIREALDRTERELTRAAGAWDPRRVDVVVVGASAGGLAALAELLGPLDRTLPATLVVVVHVSERSSSVMPSLLARRTGLEMAWAVDGSALWLGHAFVAPPGHHLLVRAEALTLTEAPPVRFLRPSVDLLFESAAEAYGRRVAGVILSGTGMDGAEGIRSIREHGGLTFAQEPGGAEFRGMPDAAIATGEVERILRADRIGVALRDAATGARPA